MDYKQLMSDLVDVAKAVAPLVLPGSEPAIAAAERVIEMIDTLTAQVPLDMDTDELLSQREELERTINSHVDRTVDRLRGKP